MTIDQALELIRTEVIRATNKHGAMRGWHEAYAILLEEVDEAWDEIKRNNHRDALAEMVQVGAMAARALVDLT